MLRFQEHKKYVFLKKITVWLPCILLDQTSTPGTNQKEIMFFRRQFLTKRKALLAQHCFFSTLIHLESPVLSLACFDVAFVPILVKGQFLFPSEDRLYSVRTRHYYFYKCLFVNSDSNSRCHHHTWARGGDPPTEGQSPSPPPCKALI